MPDKRIFLENLFGISRKNFKYNGAILVYLFFSIAIVSFVPEFFQVTPLRTPSYMFGYNNRIGVILLLILVFGASFGFKSFGISFDANGPSNNVSRSSLFIFLGIGLAGCVFMYVLTAHFHGFIESVYFIDRVQRVHDGELLYKDLEFAYGAGLIYIPVWLMSFGLSATNSYYIFWTLNILAGILILYFSINLSDFSSRKKNEIFIILVLLSFPYILFTGANYTLFRFSLPVLLSILIYRSFVRASPVPSLLPASMLIVLSTVILLAISPETAIALATGSVLYMAIYARPRSPGRVVGLLGLVAALGCVMWAADRIGVLDTLKQFGSGGANFPIVPAPHILFFSVALVLASSYVLQRLGKPGLGDSSLFLVATSLAMTAAALGLSDPLHVGLNPLGIFLAAALYASRLAIWRIFKIAFLLCMVVGPAVGLLWSYRGLIVTTVYTSLPQARPLIVRLAAGANHSEGTLKQLDIAKAAVMAGDTVDVLSAFPHADPIIDAPFGYRPNGIGSYVTSRVNTGHYLALLNVFSPQQIAMKIDELKENHRQLLLPAGYSRICLIDPHNVKVFISGLFLFPYAASVRHPENIAKPLCDYIDQNYRLLDPPTIERRDYGLWEPKA